MERKESSEALTSYGNVYTKCVSVIYCIRSQLLKMDGAGNDGNAVEEDEDAYESVGSGGDADNEDENQLMEFKQMKKRKKKEEGAKSTTSEASSQNERQSASQPISAEAPRSSSRMSASREASHRQSDAEQDTDNDAESLGSVGNSNPASPIPHEGGDVSYTSDSEYTSAEESYTYSEDGRVDSFVVANLERNELKNRVIELEENLRGKQVVLKDLNKENYELRAKLQTFQTASRQESSPSPILRKELEDLQETLRENQKRLEDINKENHEMRTKLAHGGNDDKSVSSKLEELKMMLDSKQQLLEALNFQNQELIKENNTLKSTQKGVSPDNSRSDSEIESLQESLKTKQTVLSELNRQNQELRDKVSKLSQVGNAVEQLQAQEGKIRELQSEIGLKDDEIERLKAVEASFVQTKEVMKELSLQSTQAKEELQRMKKKYDELEAEIQAKDSECQRRIDAAQEQLGKVQDEYHRTVASSNDHLMKIQILESQIETLEIKLQEKEDKFTDFDKQMSLAIGERDAVQLEARTQVEELEERIKAMQEQLQKNGASIRDYEAEISRASEELSGLKVIVAKSEKGLEDRDQQISLLEMKLEAVAMNDSQSLNERRIYQEEIEDLKAKVEDSQKEIAELNTKLIENETSMQRQLLERDSKIAELERDMAVLEKLRTEEVNNFQAHSDRILREQQEESKKRLDDTVARLSEQNKEYVEAIEAKFESQIIELESEFKRAKESEVRELQERLELEQKSQIQKVEEEVTKSVSLKSVEETKEVARAKDDQICRLEDIIRSRTEELDQCQKMIKNFEDACVEKDRELNQVGKKRELEMAENKKAKEELTKKFVEAEERASNLDNIIISVKLESEKFSRENDSLRERVAHLVGEKEEREKAFENEVSSLKEDYDTKLDKANMEILNLTNSAEKEKLELLRVANECGGIKEQLQKSIENENALRETVESLEMAQAKLIDEMNAIVEKRKEEKQQFEKMRLEADNLKEMLDRMSVEKGEYAVEVQMLKERMEMITTENNNEMIEGFNQSMERLNQEKDEQIRHLREEIAHTKEGHERYVQKMQSEFESDMKQVEDENHLIKEQLKELKIAKDREMFGVESSLKLELETVREKHGIELKELRTSMERRLEEERLKLKESHWQQLRRYEAERENELKRAVEEGEKNKAEEIEILRQQLEEEKHREVHDVVCSMTKEQKENAEALKADMEKQMRKVQEDRDAELRNIKQEYNSFKEAKRLEMEELVSSQISKYQEEQELLQKRLSKAEGRIRKLTNEKEEFIRQDSKQKEELKDLREKLASMKKSQQVSVKEEKDENEGKIIPEKEVVLESKPQERSQLLVLFEELRIELHNLSGGGEQDLSPSPMEDKDLGKSYDQSTSFESERTSLDEELSEIKRLCKGELVDLAYKLKSMKHKYEGKEKEFADMSFLNQTLKEEIERLEVELKNTQGHSEDSRTEANALLASEFDQPMKGTPQKSFDIIDGSQESKELDYMTGKLEEVSADLELKMKLKRELDASISDLRSELARVNSEKDSIAPVVVEEVPAISVQFEETTVVPEVLDELETLPIDKMDGPEYVVKADEEKAETDKMEDEAGSKDMELEMKHLQNLLFENNEKQEKQKKEIKELRDALENERSLFAEQLRSRVAKETEAREALEKRSAESALRERRELANRISMLEQCLREKERTENELKDENWRLVNLLKDNSVELLSEKESLQEQVERQEDIVKELQQKLSTGDHVSNEIQEAFGKQLAALHRQRDALIEQLEQHKREHQSYAKVVQDKAALEERLRDEKKVLSEKLRQKETVEMELAAERSALNEKLIELEKLKEVLNGKEKLAHELATQRDELKNELTAVEERLSIKEEALSHQQDELERELAAKDFALRKWEDDFKARESELIEHEESLRQSFSDVLQATRSDFEMRNEENLRQLRTDLDADYQQRIAVTETGLHDRYGQEIARLREDHDNQMNRAKGEFEERLLELRRQLDEERLRQVKVSSNTLLSECNREIMDQGGTDVDMEQLRRELEESHRLEIEKIKWEYEQTQRRIMEDLQASLITESAIRVGAARLRAEQEVEQQLREMQTELELRVEERTREIEEEKKNEIKRTKQQCEKEMQDKVDEVMREMQAEKEAEIEKLFGDNSIQEKIRFFERQLSGRPDPERVQANMELDTRHEKEVEKVKSELVQKCGDDDEMFHNLGEFESVQENYFQEKLKIVQEEHEAHLETVVRDYEILLLKTKDELHVLREEDFQRIRRLQDEIYSKEGQIIEIQKSLEDESEKFKKELKEERERHAREMFKKSEEQISLLAKEREAWENEKQREMSVLRSQYDSWLAERDYSYEMKLQEQRAMYENEMSRREMEFIQREEIIKTNYGQNQMDSRIQYLESQHEEQLRIQDTKHREELEQAVVQLSSNLKQDFNSLLAEAKAEHEAEKMQMRKDFKKVKKDALDDLREELAADYNIQLKEMKAELEHNKVTDIAKATTEISMKNAVDLENLRRDLTERYEKEIEKIKKELQKDFEENAMRQAAQMEELEIGRLEESRMARRELEDDERRAIRRELEDELSRIVAGQAEKIQELELRHAEELQLLRSSGPMHSEREDDLALNAIQLAKQMEELEMKHADEMKRLRQKYEREEVDGVKREINEEFDRRLPLQSEQIQEIELRHEKDLKLIKERYEALLAEKTQELRSEVNVLRSLLEGSQQELHKITQDFVDAAPSAPSLDELPHSGNHEYLGIPQHMLGEGPTPTGSTETIIARFRDGDVASAVNDAYKDMSSDDGSRTETSFSGSVPNMLYPGGLPYPTAGMGVGHDEVERSQESQLEEMKWRFRPSDSDSGRSGDQMMEPGMFEEDDRIAKLLHEKDDEMQAKLTKQKEELENLYQTRVRDLNEYIHSMQARHNNEMQALKNRDLQQAEEQVLEAREKAAIEKVYLQKEAHLKMQNKELESDKVLKKLIKEQEKATENLKNEHIDELRMLKHELTMESERKIKEIGMQHSKYVLETRDRYEKLLQVEREKYEKRHAEDAARLKQLMEKGLEKRQRDLVEVIRDQYESDLRQAKQSLEDNRRHSVDELTKTHMAEIERAKEATRRELTQKFEAEKEAAREKARKEYDEYMRRDLTDKVYYEIERARAEAHKEYEDQLHTLEDELADTHVKQLQTLQDVREKHKENVDNLKAKHQEELENAEKSFEEKVLLLKDALQNVAQAHGDESELNLEKHLRKLREELNEAHSKELDELNKQLTAANAKVSAFEEDKSVKEKTYLDTIQKLMEDYDSEIKKLKEAVEKYRKEELDKQDRNITDIYNTDQRIIKENFEQQMSDLKKHHELAMSDLKTKFELEKREWMEEYVEKHETKMEELKKMYDEERKECHNEMLNMDDEHTKQLDALMDKIQSLTAEIDIARRKAKEVSEENTGLVNKLEVANDQYNTLVARHERQEEENSKYIKMLSSDVEKCETERGSLKQGNERLLQTLSNAVRASALIEDMINRNLDSLIQETSRTESGAGDSGARGNGRRRNSPDRSFRARFFGGSPNKSKKDKTLGESELADWTQYSNLSGGSLLSDEGLDLSFVSHEKLFSGPELDANSEEIVRGAGERLHIAVEHLLKMLSVAARQTQDARQAYSEAASRANEIEESNQKAREEISQQLKKALEDLEKEEKLRKEWEYDARRKNSQVQAMNKENDEIKQKLDEVMKERTEKDKMLRLLEDKCVELESEKSIVAQLKNELELKLAELRTHRDKDAHDLRLENEDLKVRLAAKANDITRDELDAVLTELKDEVSTLSIENDSLREQLKESKVKESKVSKEADVLTQSNIEILETNKELLEQNESLMLKCRNLESALEETLEERSFPQTEAELKDPAFDSVDGENKTIHDQFAPSSPGKGRGSPRGIGGRDTEEILKLRDEIQELREYTEILKETNDNLCVELDKKHETELDLLNKISELEDDLYRSAQEGFESEMDDKETLITRRKNIELNLKHASAENEKLKEDLQKKEEELTALQEDLRKAKELANNTSSIIEELQNAKSLLSNKDAQFSSLVAEADLVRKTLFNKDAELSTIESELFELRDTVDDQRLTIEDQDKKIIDLLQKQEADDKTEQYVQELMEEIRKEKEVVVEKDNEIQALLEKLEVKRTQGDGEDSESKLKKLKSLQEEVLQKDKEIKRLKKAIEVSDEKRQELEQAQEVTLQKTIHHIKTEMEKENGIRIAELKADHQAVIDRMLETSKLELTELGQQFEEQIGAAERVNLHLLQNFFKNRTLNESQMPTALHEDTPVESLLNDLQSEAENIANLVTSYQINGVDPGSIEELQNSWAKEKQILLEAVKALRELVAKASNVTASDATAVGEDWRAVLLKAIEEIQLFMDQQATQRDRLQREELAFQLCLMTSALLLNVFNLDADLLNAEIETLESIPRIADQSADLITEKRKRLVDQRNSHSQILMSLNNKDRESLLQEIEQFKATVEDLSTEVEHYKNRLEEVEANANQKEELLQEYQSEIEQNLAASAQLKLELEQEQGRNSELEASINNERNTVNELKITLQSDEKKICDLASALKIEREELQEMRDIMTNEQSKAKQLEEEVQGEKDRSEKYRKSLDEERKRLEQMTLKGKANVEKLENLLQEKADQQDELNDKLTELTEEKNHLLKASELEQNHSRKIENLCEELRTKATQEKNERQRIEKVAERYQANLEEITKLFEDEKKRRMQSESALEEKVSYEVEAEEKGQQDAADKEKLEVMLKVANGTVSEMKNELDRAKARIASQDAEIMSLQSESAIKIADIKKQSAEQISEMSDIVAKSQRDFADEIERERATSRHLKDALTNLQLKFETSRSQYERLRQSYDDADGSRDSNQNTPKSSPKNKYTVSSRVLDPFVDRCSKLVKHCQEVISNEQQRMEYGAERPSERHVKELQSTYDALDALVKELSELQQDIRALEQPEQYDNSPTARLEQSHKKNEELRDHIRKLVKEKSEFRTNLAALEEQIMEYRKREAEIGETHKVSREAELQLKSEQLMWDAKMNSLKSELSKLEAEKNALERSLDMAIVENANLRNSLSKPEQFSPPEDVNTNKTKDSGWSIQKIQKLYGRCLRAESFRKALIYQKKYLLFLLGGFQETEAITLSMIAKMNDVSNADGANKKQPYGKSRAFMRFRTAARVVIATWRMKFLVRKWSKSVSKITLKSAKKEEVAGSPSAPCETTSDNRSSSDKALQIRPKKLYSEGGDGLDEPKDAFWNSTEVDSKFRSRQNGVDHEFEAGSKRNEARRGRRRDNGNIRSRPRIERHDKIETDSNPSSYAPIGRIDRSPPRAYPRPASPTRSHHESLTFAEPDNQYLNTHYSSRASSRSRSPNSQRPSPGRTGSNRHEGTVSASSGLDETNTSLNAYIKKLEALQAKLKSQGTDSAPADSRRF